MILLSSFEHDRNYSKIALLVGVHKMGFHWVGVPFYRFFIIQTSLNSLLVEWLIR